MKVQNDTITLNLDEMRTVLKNMDTESISPEMKPIMVTMERMVYSDDRSKREVAEKASSNLFVRSRSIASLLDCGLY